LSFRRLFLKIISGQDEAQKKSKLKAIPGRNQIVMEGEAAGELRNPARADSLFET